MVINLFKQRLWFGLTIVVVSIISICSCIYVRAATFKSNSYATTEYFVVPEGGYSQITYEIIYDEYYTYNNASGLNDFYKRGYFVQSNPSGATSIPWIQIYYIKHSNGAIFSDWVRGDYLLDTSKWTYGECYYDYSQTSYASNCMITGTLFYTVHCSGATVHSIGGSITIDLATEMSTALDNEEVN